MIIKDKQELLNLKADVDTVDKLIADKKLNAFRRQHGELSSILQTLKTTLANSIDFSENSELDQVINMAKTIMQDPNDQELVSDLITKLETGNYKGVNKQDVGHLKFFKNDDTSVKEYVSSILAQLKNIQSMSSED